MFAGDRVAHELGMVVSSVGPSTATVDMTVTPTMCNGLDVCHGGVIFSLADAAMAFASNGLGGTHLASDASIDWLAPARVGEQLTATAVESTRRGRTGLYHVEVYTEIQGLNSIQVGRVLFRESTDGNREIVAFTGEGVERMTIRGD